ncbi:hypothetical protein HYH03_002590 [Edaphochlamys debaryana]|uniref:Uncharacterized protein n=1 Tax=Edaphochlamys debaryana TaxID=47281 RepID=A0A835YB34_9CHLO|nr:hypothetical protein HYH03_002590 [Edaphochlamys debaryana]|eukprot:KAG2499652.1 hypothetical protein HYH03_002590 [Edaphochlamys debaryana]
MALRGCFGFCAGVAQDSRHESVAKPSHKPGQSGSPYKDCAEHGGGAAPPGADPVLAGAPREKSLLQHILEQQAALAQLKHTGDDSRSHSHGGHSPLHKPGLGGEHCGLPALRHASTSQSHGGWMGGSDSGLRTPRSPLAGAEGGSFTAARREASDTQVGGLSRGPPSGSLHRRGSARGVVAPEAPHPSPLSPRACARLASAPGLGPDDATRAGGAGSGAGSRISSLLGGGSEPGASSSSHGPPSRGHNRSLQASFSLRHNRVMPAELPGPPPEPEAISDLEDAGRAFRGTRPKKHHRHKHDDGFGDDSSARDHSPDRAGYQGPYSDSHAQLDLSAEPDSAAVGRRPARHIVGALQEREQEDARRRKRQAQERARLAAANAGTGAGAGAGPSGGVGAGADAAAGRGGPRTWKSFTAYQATQRQRWQGQEAGLGPGEEEAGEQLADGARRVVSFSQEPRPSDRPKAPGGAPAGTEDPVQCWGWNAGEQEAEAGPGEAAAHRYGADDDAASSSESSSGGSDVDLEDDDDTDEERDGQEEDEEAEEELGGSGEDGHRHKGSRRRHGSRGRALSRSNLIGHGRSRSAGPRFELRRSASQDLDAMEEAARERRRRRARRALKRAAAASAAAAAAAAGGRGGAGAGTDGAGWGRSRRRSNDQDHDLDLEQEDEQLLLASRRASERFQATRELKPSRSILKNSVNRRSAASSPEDPARRGPAPAPTAGDGPAMLVLPASEMPAAGGAEVCSAPVGATASAHDAGARAPGPAAAAAATEIGRGGGDFGGGGGETGGGGLDLPVGVAGPVGGSAPVLLASRRSGSFRDGSTPPPPVRSFSPAKNVSFRIIVGSDG